MQQNLILKLFGRKPAEESGDMHGAEKDTSDLEWICRSVLSSAFPAFRNVGIEAEYYPYIGLTHTIRRKGHGWTVRISDHCRHAPRAVVEAIIMILGSKIARKVPPRRFLQIYDAYRKEPSVVESVRVRRQQKGRKNFAVSEGKHHSLNQMFTEINSAYFNDQIEVKKIGWGVRKGWRRLGHYDPTHHTITLSPALDSKSVPEYVVRYIVYHEMLHVVFEDVPTDRFRKHHPPEFHQAERAYPDYVRAKRFLRDHFGKRRLSVDE